MLYHSGSIWIQKDQTLQLKVAQIILETERGSDRSLQLKVA